MLDGRARFLQDEDSVRNGRPRLGQGPARDARRFGLSEPCAGLIERGRRFAQGALCLASLRGLPVSSLPGGILGPLTAVEGVAEGEAVIPLNHRILRLLEGADGCLILLGGIPIGPGGAGGVDSALGLTQLALRRCGACGRKTSGDKQDE